MEISFESNNAKQIQAAEYWIDSETEEILYGGAKYGGKTYLGCSLIFGDALIYPETQYFIARQTLSDLRKFTIPSIHERFKHWGLDVTRYASFNGQDNIFNLYNGSKVYLLECKQNPSDPMFERFGSMQMTRGWIEEGGEVVEAAKANLYLSIGRWKNDIYNLKKKLLITANPKKGWMKRDFVDPFKNGTMPYARKYIQAFPTDNLHGSKDYIESLRKEKDLVRRQRLFEGDWDYDEDKDSLISYDALTDAFTNTVVRDNQRYLVVDVARLGKDKTVFSFWDGLELYELQMFQKQDTQRTEQQVKDFAAIHHIPYSNIIVDEDGVGGGVVDHLFGIKSFVANSSPLPTANEIKMKHSTIEHSLVPKRNFKNLKSQAGFKLAELINERKISFSVDQRDTIMEELTSLLRQKDFDSEGKLQLRPKDLVKAELGRSPDVGDTLIMRMFFELRKEALDENPELSAVRVTQQNNFLYRKEAMVQNSTE